jgi:hypothetical protein
MHIRIVIWSLVIIRVIIVSVYKLLILRAN